MASDVPNMDLRAIKNRLAEENAVLFEDRNFLRRRRLWEGSYMRVRNRYGAFERITAGGTWFDPIAGEEITVINGQKFKRSVRILVRQWKRIPDREREPLYEFLRQYASVKNVGDPPPESGWKTTCWIERPMIDGEELPGFWKMLRTWESRYRMNDPNEQGVFQALMFKGDWELDVVPDGADDDNQDGDAGECIASSPLHHIDREIFIGAGDVPSCEHKNDRGHIYEASGSFSEEDGTWMGHIDDDIARDPGDFETWSGSVFGQRRRIIGGTHKEATALPSEEDLENRLVNLGKENRRTYHYDDEEGQTVTEHPDFRDDYGRPMKWDEQKNDYVPVNGTPWDIFDTQTDKYGTAIKTEQKNSGRKGINLTRMGVSIETSADLDNYGLFSTREHDTIAHGRRVFFMEGGHIHDSWTNKSYKSAFLPSQNIAQGNTIQLSVDLDEDGMFNFIKTLNFAHQWTAWHAMIDASTLSVVYEFHNAMNTVPPKEDGNEGPALALEKGIAKLTDMYGKSFSFEGKARMVQFARVSGDHDKNEYGLFDGRVNYVFPILGAITTSGATTGKDGQTGETTVIRNVDYPTHPNDDPKRIKIGDTEYSNIGSGKSMTWRATKNAFGLYDVTIQKSNAYPDWDGSPLLLASYGTRQAWIRVGNGRRMKTYNYSSTVSIWRCSTLADAQSKADTWKAGISSGGAGASLINRDGEWNDGSSISYEGNGVWIARAVKHFYNSVQGDGHTWEVKL